jgi:hypothetical protein
MMHSEQAQQLLAAHGPFASVYFNDSHDAPDAAAQLDVKWRDSRRDLEEQGAQASLIAQLEGAIDTGRPPVGRSGRGVIAGADGVVITEHLVVSPSTSLVRVSELPYVVPLVEYGPIAGPYMVVAVDHVGADLIVYQGNTVRTKTVDAGGYPIHKAASAGVNGWGDSQHRVDEAVRKNVHAVAHQLNDFVDHRNVEVIFVIGQDRVRAELLEALAERVAVRVAQPGVGARHTGVDDAVSQAIALEFQNRRLRGAVDIADRFRAEAGRASGLAVAGLAGVCAALREGAVETLIIGDIENDTVLAGDDPNIIATDADTLSSFGVAPTRILRADEAIPFAAMAAGAALVRADDSLRLPDGVAALLRYAPPGWLRFAPNRIFRRHRKAVKGNGQQWNVDRGRCRWH